MTDYKHTDPTRYALTLDDGTQWTYEPTLRAYPWKNGRLIRYAIPCKSDRDITAAELRRAADIVERWEQDHKPKMRRRVVQDGRGYWWALHSRSRVFVSADSPQGAMDYAANPAAIPSHIRATCEDVALLADLLANPDEPEPTDD